MEFYERLFAETTEARRGFMSIPVIKRAVVEGVSRDLYLAFLGQAFHHVKHTCPLLQRAISHCRPADERYRKALQRYIDEERGHEEWILDDIRALGGDTAAARAALPGLPCRIMVAYAYYAIEQFSPYAMLGMVHVLEGMSVALAQLGAEAVKRSLGVGADAGFSYLTSHGALDQDHVAFFRDLVNGIADPSNQAHIVETANVIYRLYGDIFRALDESGKGAVRAA